MGLENSKDILYLVISFCVLWITVFLCWVFYYVMRLLRNANQITEEFRLRLQMLTETINHIRGKVEHISDFFTLAGSGVGSLVKKVVTRKAEHWLDDSADSVNSAAKLAVHKAVAATAAKLKKTAKKIRK